MPKLFDSRSVLFACLTLVLAAPAAQAAVHAPSKASRVTAAPADPVPGLIARAQAAQASGDVELALRLAQAAIVANPMRTSSYDALADIYAAQGEPGFATHYYQEALSIDPGDSAAIQAMASLNRKGPTRAASAEPAK